MRWPRTATEDQTRFVDEYRDLSSNVDCAARMVVIKRPHPRSIHGRIGGIHDARSGTNSPETPRGTIRRSIGQELNGQASSGRLKAAENASWSDNPSPSSVACERINWLACAACADCAIGGTGGGALFDLRHPKITSSMTARYAALSRRNADPAISISSRLR